MSEEKWEETVQGRISSMAVPLADARNMMQVVLREKKVKNSPLLHHVLTQVEDKLEEIEAKRDGAFTRAYDQSDALQRAELRLADSRDEVERLRATKTELDERIKVLGKQLGHDQFSDDEVAAWRKAPNKINLIKMYRQRTGLGLKEAKDWVEANIERLEVETGVLDPWGPKAKDMPANVSM